MKKYLLNDIEIAVHDNGYFVTIADTTATINYSGNIGSGEYVFENVPNDNKT